MAPKNAHTTARLVIADDHAVLRLGLEIALARHPRLRRVASVADSGELVDFLQGHPCDVLVTDFRMPGGRYGDGLEMLAYLRGHYPRLRIVVLTMVDDPDVLRGISGSGASALLSKEDDIKQVCDALFKGSPNEPYVSPRLRRLMADGPRRGAKADGARRRDSEAVCAPRSPA